MPTRHASVYRVRETPGGPDVYEAVCDSCEFSEVFATEREAELAAGDHDDAEHGE